MNHKGNSMSVPFAMTSRVMNMVANVSICFVMNVIVDTLSIGCIIMKK